VVIKVDPHNVAFYERVLEPPTAPPGSFRVLYRTTNTSAAKGGVRAGGLHNLSPIVLQRFHPSADGQGGNGGRESSRYGPTKIFAC
jgi:hypothetical protein